MTGLSLEQEMLIADIMSERDLTFEEALEEIVWQTGDAIGPASARW